MPSISVDRIEKADCDMGDLLRELGYNQRLLGCFMDQRELAPNLMALESRANQP